MREIPLPVLVTDVTKESIVSSISKTMDSVDSWFEYFMALLSRLEKTWLILD